MVLVVRGLKRIVGEGMGEGIMSGEGLGGYEGEDGEGEEK